MKKTRTKLILALACVVLVLLAIRLFESRPRRDGPLYKVPEMTNLRQFGNASLMFASENEEKLPSRFDELLPMFGENSDSLFDFFRSSRFTYHHTDTLVSELPDDYILATYEYPGAGKYVLNISGGIIWIENEK